MCSNCVLLTKLNLAGSGKVERGGWGVSKDWQRFADTDSGLADAAKIKLLFLFEKPIGKGGTNTSLLNTAFSQISYLSNLCEEDSNQCNFSNGCLLLSSAVKNSM